MVSTGLSLSGSVGGGGEGEREREGTEGNGQEDGGVPICVSQCAASECSVTLLMLSAAVSDAGLGKGAEG